MPGCVPACLLCGGAPAIPGCYHETRGPSDGVAFISSCQDTTGIASVAAVHLIPGGNHLMLGWEPSDEPAVAGWLG